MDPKAKGSGVALPEVHMLVGLDTTAAIMHMQMGLLQIRKREKFGIALAKDQK